MRMRAAAAILWFLAGWYAAAYIALIFGLTNLIGPVVGAALAAVVAGDPMHRIWTRLEPQDSTARSAGSQTVNAAP